MEEGVEHHQQALLSSEARYLEAEEGRILDEIDAWTRDRGAEVVRSDKLMVLLRSCEQHKGGGEEAAAGVVHTPPVVPCSHSPESQGEGDSATSGKSESDGQTPERHARREAGEEEAEDEEEEEKAEAEWEVELARLEGKMSLTLLKGKRQVQTHKNESESESEEGQVETDCMDKLSAAAVVGSVGAEDTEAGAEAKGPESKHAGESDGKEVRAGMKQLLQRTQVARELVRTEEDYVNFLATGLVSGYLQPLKQAIGSGGKRDEFGLDEADLKVIFSSIKIIINFHRNLLHDFHMKMESWSFCQTLGDIFLANADFMKVPYIDYTNNYTLALTTLEEKCKNARLAAFLEQCRVESNVKALESLLIMPIQRVPRYELLLKQLIKYTPPWHMDHASLQESLTKIQDIAEKINQRRMECDRVHDLVFVSRQLSPKIEDLVSPHRRLVRQGTFHEVPLDSSRASSFFGLRSLHLFLFNDVLLITERNIIDDSINFFSGQRRFRVQKVLPLHNSVILEARQKKNNRKTAKPKPTKKESSDGGSVAERDLSSESITTVDSSSTIPSLSLASSSATAACAAAAASTEGEKSDRSGLGLPSFNLNLNFISAATERNQEQLWKLVFKIYSPNGKIQLLAPTLQVKQEWVEDLAHLVHKQSEYHRTFLSAPLATSSSPAHSPSSSALHASSSSGTLSASSAAAATIESLSAPQDHHLENEHASSRSFAQAFSFASPRISFFSSSSSSSSPTSASDPPAPSSSAVADGDGSPASQTSPVSPPSNSPPQFRRVSYWARAYPQSFLASPLPSPSSSAPGSPSSSCDSLDELTNSTTTTASASASLPTSPRLRKDRMKASHLISSQSLRNIVEMSKKPFSSSSSDEDRPISISSLTSPPSSSPSSPAQGRSSSSSSSTASMLSPRSARSGSSSGQHLQSFLSPPPQPESDRSARNNRLTLNLRPLLWSKETKLKREWRDQYDQVDDDSEARGVSVRRRNSDGLPSFWNRPQAIAVYRRRPEWVPDEFSPYCANCGAQFSLTVRRHHCRQCGNIFCSPCASEQRTLSHFGYQTPVRVCDVCVRQLDQWEHEMGSRRRKAKGHRSGGGQRQQLAASAPDTPASRDDDEWSQTQPEDGNSAEGGNAEVVDEEAGRDRHHQLWLWTQTQHRSGPTPSVTLGAAHLDQQIRQEPPSPQPPSPQSGLEHYHHHHHRLSTSGNGVADVLPDE